MPYFQVIGDDGYTQVDDTYSTLTMVEKGNPKGNYQPNFYYGGSAANPPLIVFRSTTRAVTLLYILWQDGAWRWAALATGSQTNDPMTDVTYRIYDRAYSSPSTFGHQAFDAGGNLVFDALRKVLRVKSDRTAYAFGTSTDISEPAGKEYGWLVCVTPSRTYTSNYTSAAPWNNFTNYAGLQWVNGTLTVYEQNVRQWQDSGSRFIDRRTSGSFILCDVTNH